jgi:hypothetical protein
MAKGDGRRLRIEHRVVLAGVAGISQRSAAPVLQGPTRRDNPTYPCGGLAATHPPVLP